MTGAAVRPPTTLGRAPSIPATTIRTRAASSRFRASSRRWIPATPTSKRRSTARPIAAPQTAASSATGRSAVPAQQTSTGPGSAPGCRPRARPRAGRWSGRLHRSGSLSGRWTPRCPFLAWRASPGAHVHGRRCAVQFLQPGSSICPDRRPLRADPAARRGGDRPGQSPNPRRGRCERPQSDGLRRRRRGSRHARRRPGGRGCWRRS